MVIDSRPKDGTVYRRRECLNCGARWSTTEAPIEEPDHTSLDGMVLDDVFWAGQRDIYRQRYGAFPEKRNDEWPATRSSTTT